MEPLKRYQTDNSIDTFMQRYCEISSPGAHLILFLCSLAFPQTMKDIYCCLLKQGTSMLSWKILAIQYDTSDIVDSSHLEHC